jgi:hypothetical protein
MENRRRKWPYEKASWQGGGRLLMDGLVSIGSLFSGSRLERKESYIEDELRSKLKQIIRQIEKEKEEIKDSNAAA